MNDSRTPSLDGLVRAFLPFGICGLAGVLVDLDHLVRPIKLLLAGTTPTWNDIAGRPLHPFVFLVGWTVCGVIAACSVGQLFVRWLGAE